MLSTEGKITQISSEVNTEIQEPKGWASEVFGVGRRNSSFPPLAAVMFQKCVVPLKRQWRAWGGAALGKTQPVISPRHNLRPMNKRKDFHWFYLPTDNCAWPKSASSVSNSHSMDFWAGTAWLWLLLSGCCRADGCYTDASLLSDYFTLYPTFFLRLVFWK